MKGKSLISATRKAWSWRRNGLKGRRQGFFRAPTGAETGKQFVITAEKTETYIIHAPKASLRVFCPTCDEEITCLTMEQAVSVTGMAARKIFLLVEAGEVHGYETDEGFLLLCPKSIGRFVQL